MDKTTFRISRLVCPSEENLIRLKLDEISEIKNLDFDIPNRQLTVFHTGNLSEIENSIFDLNLGGKRLKTEHDEQTDFTGQTQQRS